jgi:hypothetical protein
MTDLSDLESIIFKLDILEKEKQKLECEREEIIEKIFNNKDKIFLVEHLYKSSVSQCAIFRSKKDADRYCNILKMKNKQKIKESKIIKRNYTYEVIEITFGMVLYTSLIVNMAKFEMNRKRPIIILGLKRFRTTILNINGNDVVTMIAKMLV